jgi:hypothetical protein
MTKIAPMFLVVVAIVAASRAYAQNIDTVGGCMIMHMRATAQPVSSMDAFCNAIPPARLPDGRLIFSLYEWAPPFLENAFDNAERAHCGFPGCATANRHVRLVLYADSNVNAFVRPYASGEVIIAISTALVDFVEFVTTHLLEDVFVDPSGMRAPNGLSAWLDTLDQYGGQQCSTRYRPPATTLDIQQHFVAIRAAAASVYIFIFAHELSHYIIGSSCGAQSLSPMDVEQACDRIAFTKAADYGLALPVELVATFVAMHSFERLAGPILTPPGGGSNLETAFPARNWTARAEAIIGQWQNLCAAGNTGQMCSQHWNMQKTYAERLTSVSLPAPCMR